MSSIYIAWRYLSFNKIKTLTIIICITVILSLPILLNVLVNEAESQLRSRAATTPLLIGEHGSAMDLVLSSLYFTDDTPSPMTLAVNEKLIESGLAQAIPLYRKFDAEGFPIIGTNVDYFQFRNVSVTQGRLFLYLGECVLGATVAAQLGLHPGDNLFSSSDNLFDLAGVYPLKMIVSGVLEQTHSADDLAVFVDLKTTWIIAGLGHGHKDLKNINAPDVILNRDAKNISANAKLLQYNEITSENMADFHFHGDMSAYPISAIITIPDDARSEAILKGRFISPDIHQQIVRPAETINILLERIFQIKKIVDGATLFVTLSTMLALILVFALSIRLREREFEVLFKLGCVSSAMARLLFAEITLILIISGTLIGIFLSIAWHYRGIITRILLFN